MADDKARSELALEMSIKPLMQFLIANLPRASFDNIDVNAISQAGLTLTNTNSEYTCNVLLCTTTDIGRPLSFAELPQEYRSKAMLDQSFSLLILMQNIYRSWVATSPLYQRLRHTYPTLPAELVICGPTNDKLGYAEGCNTWITIGYKVIKKEDATMTDAASLR